MRARERCLCHPFLSLLLGRMVIWYVDGTGNTKAEMSTVRVNDSGISTGVHNKVGPESSTDHLVLRDTQTTIGV